MRDEKYGRPREVGQLGYKGKRMGKAISVQA